MPVHSGDSLLEVLGRSVEVFRRARIPYALIGAWALAAWGRPRATLDLDFLVMVSEADLDRLAARFARAGMKRDEAWLKWNPALRGSQLRLRYAGFTIDLLRPRDPHDRQALRRRRRRRLGGGYCWIVAPEDFVLQKLKVGRPRDLEDAQSVLERSRGRLDRPYLRRWARRLGVAAEMEYILSL